MNDLTRKDGRGNAGPTLRPRAARVRGLAALAALALALPEAAGADTLFRLDPLRDGLIGGIALGAFAPSLFVAAGDRAALPALAAGRGGVNALDRALMFPYDATLDTVSSVAAYGALALPALAFLDPGLWQAGAPWGDLAVYAVMYGEAFLLTSATKDLLKAAAGRNRPYTYYDDYDGIPPGQGDEYFNSFPSGHTAFAFLGASFLSAVFVLDRPGSPWTVPVIAGGYTLAAATAALRVLSGNHFLTDALAGALIGSLYGWVVPLLHLESRAADLSLQPLPNGLALRVRL